MPAISFIALAVSRPLLSLAGSQKCSGRQSKTAQSDKPGPLPPVDVSSWSVSRGCSRAGARSNKGKPRCRISSPRTAELRYYAN
jgi:hypothetical protein